MNWSIVYSSSNALVILVMTSKTWVKFGWQGMDYLEKEAESKGHWD